MSQTTFITFLFFIFTVAMMYLARQRSTSGHLVGDADVIAQLRKAGSDLNRSHPVEFFLYFPTEDAARRVGDAMCALGFTSAIQPASSGSLDWLVIATRKMVPAVEVMRELRKDLSALSAAEGGEYDGWGTSLVK
jgi:hypothetical protein